MSGGVVAKGLGLIALVGALLVGTPSGRAADSAPSSSSSSPPSNAAASAGVVNLNQAKPDELELLPGIGPAKAKKIVEYRTQHPFRKTEELTKVKGIGRKTFGKLRPYLTLQGPTTLRSEPRN